MELSRNEKHHASAACPRVFSGPDISSAATAWPFQSLTPVPVSQHASHCKPMLLLANGKAERKVVSVQCRTSREFCQRDSPSVTDMQRTHIFSATPVSERARLKSLFMKASRLPYNQPMERTPPRCALRRRSSARYMSAG